MSKDLRGHRTKTMRTLAALKSSGPPSMRGPPRRARAPHSTRLQNLERLVLTIAGGAGVVVGALYLCGLIMVVGRSRALGVPPLFFPSTQMMMATGFMGAIIVALGLIVLRMMLRLIIPALWFSAIYIRFLVNGKVPAAKSSGILKTLHRSSAISVFEWYVFLVVGGFLACMISLNFLGQRNGERMLLRIRNCDDCMVVATKSGDVMGTVIGSDDGRIGIILPDGTLKIIALDDVVTIRAKSQIAVTWKTMLQRTAPIF